MQKEIISNLVSVIVPVYNVELYIEKSVASIMKQTYKSIEIILVDDGATDSSGELCDQYARLDDRIKVIHKKNGGLSSARNAGIDIAKGEYLVFVDSDDMIHPQMIEVLYQTARRYDCKLAICDFQKTNTLDVVSAEVKDYSIIQYTTQQLFSEYYNDPMYPKIVVAWNKLYHYSIFEELRYENGKIHEDEFLIIEMISKVEKAVFIQVPFYYYFMRDDSIMNRKFNLKRLDILLAFKNHIVFFEQNGMKQYERLAYFRFCDSIIENYYRCKKSGLCEEAKNLKNQFDSIWKEKVHNYQMRMLKRFKYIVYRFTPGILSMRY